MCGARDRAMVDGKSGTDRIPLWRPNIELRGRQRPAAQPMATVQQFMLALLSLGPAPRRYAAIQRGRTEDGELPPDQNVPEGRWRWRIPNSEVAHSDVRFRGDGLVRNGGNGRKAKGQDLAVAGRG